MARARTATAPAPDTTQRNPLIVAIADARADGFDAGAINVGVIEEACRQAEGRS